MLQFRDTLWSATIADVLVPADPEARYPSEGAIALSSGWYVVETSYAPIGITPSVFVVQELKKPMVSVWSVH
jgi:hypothetical protein